MRGLHTSQRLLLSATLLSSSVPVFAQDAIVFKHFKQYPAGQWSTEVTPTRGSTVTQPITATGCSSPINPSRQAAIANLGNSAALGCKSKVLRDEERTAEYQQVCNGVVVQTISVTLHAVDEKTVKAEIRSAIPGHPETIMQSTSRYLGACPANQAGPAETAGPAAAKATPEECAEVSSMHKQAEEGLRSCDTADFPEAMRASCKTRLQSLLKVVEQTEHSCGR